MFQQLLGLSVWWQIASLFFASCVLSPLALWGFMRLFRAWGVLDRPHLYPHEKRTIPLPYGMGIVIPAAATAAILLFADPTLPKLPVVLAFGFFVTVVSFFDDLDTIGRAPFRLPPLVRLAMQVLVGGIIGLTSIKIGYISGLFGGVTHIDDVVVTLFGQNFHVVAILFTVVWYVLVFNALNWSDTVPGLTGGLGVVALVVIAVLTVKLYVVDSSSASEANSLFVFRMVAALLPAVAVVAYADSRRWILMGDTGTMFLAFALATLAIVSGGKVATVAIVLGIPLVDAIYVILRRISLGKNPLKGDRIHHLHFRLMNLGMKESEIRAIFFSVSLVLGIAVVFLDRVGKVLLLLALVAFVLFITRIVKLVFNAREPGEEKKKG